MRTLATLAVVIAALSLSTHDARAQGKYWPWCAYYNAWTYNCGFTTFQQCLATISGAGGFCRQNPYGPPAADARKRKRRY